VTIQVVAVPAEALTMRQDMCVKRVVRTTRLAMFAMNAGPMTRHLPAPPPHQAP
jgi:hypothetical protein